MGRGLQGTWRAEHLFAGRHALDAFEFYGQQLAHCDQAIEADWQRLRITDVEPDMGKKRGPEAGGKARLGRITKRGDDRLRTRLIQGAKSAVMAAGKRSDCISQWLVQSKKQVGWQKAVVALANKNARILLAVLTRDGRFDPNHVPEAAAPHCALSQRPAL